MESSQRPSREPVTNEAPAPGAHEAEDLVELAAPPGSAAPELLAVPDASQPRPAAAPAMDSDFIERNQIIERYLSGKLPLRGASEFERYCNTHPEVLEKLGLADQVNAALRLLEAGGKPAPWEPPSKRFWENPWLALGLALALLAMATISFSLARDRSAARRTVAALRTQIARQPLEPPTQTRTFRLLPSAEGPTSSPVVVLGRDGQTQLDELLLDLSRSPYHRYRVTIDRIGEGRVAVINNLAKDSNGNLYIALNSSALGPGDYRFTIEGLTWRGHPVPDSWITIGIAH